MYLLLGAQRSNSSVFCLRALCAVLAIAPQGCQPPEAATRVLRSGAEPVPRTIAIGSGCSDPLDASTVAQDSAAGNQDASSRTPADRERFAQTRFVERVMIISVDGFGGSYLERGITENKLPNFAALKRWGASTSEARADFTHTVTLPNHTSIISGRPVQPVTGLAADVNHGYTDNGIPGPEQTLHTANPNLAYLPSVFDVAHDHGLRTCFYAGKPKFILFVRSYDATHGAPDALGSDDGRNKIDRCVIAEERTADLVATAAADIDADQCDLVFVHIPDLDGHGHQSGWGSEDWWRALSRVDTWIGQLTAFGAPERSPRWGVVLTADHGGREHAHDDPTMYENYRIPFFAVAPGVPAASELYVVAADRRRHPGSQRPDYPEPIQPIRNLDAADAALSMLGLESINGSLAQGLLRGLP